MKDIKFSIIIPVYNRPDEIKELFDSLEKQTFKDFEVVVVEDGSKIKSEEIIKKYKNLNVKYFFKENEGPSIARNFAMKNATGNYFLFFDSDCILQKDTLFTINKELKRDFVDCFGGADKSHKSFNFLQKAISYSMTSVFTTGGIRGNKKHISKFYPRSFNMGISKKVFEKIGGFPVTKMHPGEDMVFSIEIIKQGFRTKLLDNVTVYHKRRTSLEQFQKQVFKFGKTRYVISLIYPETFKIFYVFPTLFVVFFLFAIKYMSFSIDPILTPFFAYTLSIYNLLIFIDSTIKNKNPIVGLISVWSSYIQLISYGLGFFISYFKYSILRMDEYKVFSEPFYKKKK